MKYAKFIIERYDEELVTMPIWLTIIIAIAAPWVTGIGMIAALVGGCSFRTEMMPTRRAYYAHYEDAEKDWRQDM